MEGIVTAMGDKQCAVCEAPFGGEPAYLVNGGRWMRRRWHRRLLLICCDCYDNRRGLGNSDHRKYPVYYMDMVGRGFNVMPPTACEACGQLVIRVDDPLLKRVTCSRACSTSLTRSRNGNRGSGQPCEVCQVPITSGRADSRTCSSACRQKAYRQRKAHA